MNKKVSIIVPIYNAEKYIKECLDSLISQTYKNIEIICVDDCSKDCSLQIVKDYMAKDSRIKIFKNKKNSGPSISRNLGIENSSGDFLMFIDSDDYILEDSVEKIINTMTDDIDFILFNGRSFIKNNKITGWFYYYTSITGVPKNSAFKATEYPDVFFILNVATACIRKSFIGNNRFLSGKYFEDWEFMWHLYSFNPKVKYLDECLYYYRRDVSSSVSHTFTNKKINDLFYTFDTCLKRFKERNDWNNIEYCVYVVAFNHFSVLYKQLRLNQSLNFALKLKKITDTIPSSLVYTITKNNLKMDKMLFHILAKGKPYFKLELILHKLGLYRNFDTEMVIKLFSNRKNFSVKLEHLFKDILQGIFKPELYM